MQSNPIVKDLVLIGGGHSHVLLLRKLGMHPIAGLRITLISPDYLTPYSGMLPGVVAGHYQPQDIHIDLIPLCRFAGAQFIEARVDDIDPYARRVEIPGRPALEYDALSIDIGITPSVDVPGVLEHGIPVKPIGGFLKQWDQFLARAKNGEINSVAIVGAGAGGVELTLAIHERLRREQADKHIDAMPDMHLISASDTLLPGYHPDVQVRFRHHLRQRNISIHTGARVSEVTESSVLNDFGGEISADATFWVTNAASQSWLAKTGLQLSEAGFIEIKPTLQSVNFDSVFATGDIADNPAYPRPKAGVFAVRQGPVLYANIRRFLLGRKPKAYKPQHRFLSLITTGGQHAVASKGSFRTEGRWVWRWKNWIDQKFMNQFRVLPDMKVPSMGGLLSNLDDQMRCGGCGSKVSGDLLAEVLRNTGLKMTELDDAATYEPPVGKVMLHTIDSFRSFTEDTYRFARIAVHHALSDIYAMGGEPVTALATITVPYGTPGKIRGSLEQLIAGSLEVLKAEQVTLAGGHTTEGAEMSIGFAVNGLADKDSLMTKGGLKQGQCLILTKPLGTGTLLAADMQHRAAGNWMKTAMDSMDQSNREAANIFRAAGVTACTDITGFGLAGHLLEMLRASKATAVVDLRSLPVLPGAQQCIGKLNIKSTLNDGNRAACIEMTADPHPLLPLVFDPQTSGGLLAAVAPDQVTSLLQSLREAGYEQARHIGRITSQSQTHLFFESTQ